MLIGVVKYEENSKKYIIKILVSSTNNKETYLSYLNI